MRDTQNLLTFLAALPGTAAIIWLWRVVVSNERRRKHDRQLIERNSRRVNVHERYIAKMEDREVHLLHPIYDDQDEEEEPY